MSSSSRINMTLSKVEMNQLGVYMFYVDQAYAQGDFDDCRRRAMELLQLPTTYLPLLQRCNLHFYLAVITAHQEEDYRLAQTHLWEILSHIGELREIDGRSMETKVQTLMKEIHPEVLASKDRVAEHSKARAMELREQKHLSGTIPEERKKLDAMERNFQHLSRSEAADVREILAMITTWDRTAILDLLERLKEHLMKLDGHSHGFPSDDGVSVPNSPTPATQSPATSDLLVQGYSARSPNEAARKEAKRVHWANVLADTKKKGVATPRAGKLVSALKKTKLLSHPQSGANTRSSDDIDLMPDSQVERVR